MATVALLRGKKMTRGHADGRRAVVAGVAAAGHTTVIEAHAGPGRRRGMAVVALGRGLDMPGRFARCADPVMAGGAGTAHPGMVETDIGPGRGR